MLPTYSMPTWKVSTKHLHNTMIINFRVVDIISTAQGYCRSICLHHFRYREKAKELSLAFHDRPVPPQKELVHWIEHVVRTNGAKHLRSPALMMPWYQKMYIDLLVAIAFTTATLIILVKYLLASTKHVDSKKKTS